MKPNEPAARPLVAVLRDPVVPILVMAGVFDWLSGNQVHSLLLFAVALALVRDKVRPGREMRRAEGLPFGLPVPPAWLLVLTGICYAVLMGEFGRYSWPATLAVLLAAAAGLGLAWNRPLGARPDPAPIGLRGGLAWGSLGVALGLWELSALLLQPSLTTDSYAHPTISVLTDPTLASHAGRSIVLFVWLCVGWFLVTA